MLIIFEALNVDLEQYGPRQRCGQAGIEPFDRYPQLAGFFHPEDGLLALA